MIMKRKELIETVKNVCSVRKGVLGVNVFDDSYLVKDGRNRRLKFSGVYDKEDELERLRERLVGKEVEGRERWKIMKVYRRVDSEEMNWNWRNDSGCVCVIMKKM